MARILASLFGIHLAGCVVGNGNHSLCPCVTPPALSAAELSAAETM